MKECLVIWIFLLCSPLPCLTQVKDSLLFQGQASAWINLNPSNDLPIWFGGRYIPQMNYGISGGAKDKLDLEFSANIYGSSGIYPFDSLYKEGSLKPYRMWARYSTNQLELRIGLQKINFGSAYMFRPLMWFDQLDPRDPLQLTDGVWGVLCRYYFLNNANIWFWGLYKNEGPKTWEIGKTTEKAPEIGGRFQMPIPRGEAALSFHHRNADTRGLTNNIRGFENVPENRLGFDGKWDVEIGLWMEASWIKKSRYTGIFTNQHILNLGADYTIGIGNGINMVFENMLFSYDEKAFAFANNNYFSGTSISYPLGILDNISAIVYYDWTNNNFYNFINWQRKFNRFAFYLMGFWNPQYFQLPQQKESGQMFSGKGVQVMLVLNH